MTTDFTELAKNPTRYGTNSQGVFTNQTDGAYVSYLDFVALVEALEKAQRHANLTEAERQAYLGLISKRDERIAELESRTVKLPKHSVGEVMHMSGFSRDYAEGWCAGNDNAIHVMRVAGIKVEGE